MATRPDIYLMDCGKMSSLFKIEEGAGELWSEDELCSILQHQLQAPLEIDLPAKNSQELRLLARAAMAGIRTFEDLFHHPNPPLALLRLTKEFAKPLGKRASGRLPPAVAKVLYYASIVVARQRRNRRIASQSETELQEGIKWVLQQSWVETSTRALFTAQSQTHKQTTLVARASNETSSHVRDVCLRPGMDIGGPYRRNPNIKAHRWYVLGVKEGGMGIVYIIYDRELHDILAAKTCRDELFHHHPLAAELFKKEALTWLKLDVHPNVAEAVMVKQINEKPFLFLRYANGGDLQALIQKPRLRKNLRLVVNLAIQFCDGMLHAASRGLVAHRDIKPGNCLVTRDGTLKITDFGLAKVLDKAPAPLQNLLESWGCDPKSDITLAGSSAGTPAYMAPEQFDDVGRVNERADVYSFGVMLFQMIEGELPFRANTKDEYKERHQHALPPQLTADLTSGKKRLNLVIQKCLEKSPVHRYQSFAEVRRDLVAVYRSLTGRTIPTSTMSVAVNPLLLINKGLNLHELGFQDEGLNCYAAALACLEKCLSVQPRRPSAGESLAGQLVARCEAVLSLDLCNEVALGVLDALQSTNVALRFFDHELKHNPNDPLALQGKGDALTRLNRLDDAISCYNRILCDNPADVCALESKGYAYYIQHNYPEALRCFTRALELDGEDWEKWCNTGDLHLAMGNRAEGFRCYIRAVQLDPQRRLTKRDLKKWHVVV